jgi:hypothetical protein
MVKVVGRHLSFACHTHQGPGSRKIVFNRFARDCEPSVDLATGSESNGGEASSLASAFRYSVCCACAQGLK